MLYAEQWATSRESTPVVSADRERERASLAGQYIVLSRGNITRMRQPWDSRERERER